MEDQFAAGRSRVDGPVTDRLEPDPALPQVFDDIDQVAYRPPQAIKPPDDEGVAGLEVLQALVKAGPRGLRSADLVSEDVVLAYASFPQGVELKLKLLFAGRDAGVSDKAVV